MNFGRLLLYGTILSLVTVYVLAAIFESGDNNAVSLYFVVFLLPVLFVAIINALFISRMVTIKNKMIRVLGSFIPLCIYLLVLLFADDIKIPGIDGNLVFVFLSAAISLGFTNMIWLYKNLTTADS